MLTLVANIYAWYIIYVLSYLANIYVAMLDTWSIFEAGLTGRVRFFLNFRGKEEEKRGKGKKKKLIKKWNTQPNLTAVCVNGK